MERKQFLGATAMAGAALAMIGVASASTTTDTSNSVNCVPAPHPRPSGSPVAHIPHARPSEIESAYRHVERVIEMLATDKNDYDGHRVPALGYLNQAANELEQAIAYAQAHPSMPPPL